MSTTGTYSYDSQIGVQVGETDDGQPLFAEAGDGSLTGGEAIKDTDRPDHRHAAHGQQRTTFHAAEADDSERFRRLWKHQHGYHDDGSGKRATADKVRVAEALADSLRLSDSLTAEVKRIVQQVDGRPLNKIGGLEAVALGAIAVVQNRTIEQAEDYDNRIQVRYITDYDGERIYSHDLPRFKWLAEKHDVDWNAAISKVKEQVSGR